MIIIIRKYGQTCNRLFQYAHFYAFCKENNIRLLNPSFHDLTKHFEKVADECADSSPVKIKYIFKSIFCLLNGRFINLDSDEKNLRAKSLFNKYDYLAAGWSFRDGVNFIKYAEDIRKFFRIKDELIKVTEQELLKKRNEFDTIIGIHIRRGDYEIWCNGKYYYDDESYLSFMNQMVNLLHFKKLLFIICSNEPLDQDRYKSIENENLNIWIPQKNFINELYLLSRCDMILGPPSTFTLWASFYGNIPYFHLTNKDIAITLKDFKVCNG